MKDLEELKEVADVDENGNIVNVKSAGALLLMLKSLMAKNPNELLASEKKALSKIKSYYSGKFKNKVDGVEGKIKSTLESLADKVESKGFELIAPAVSPLLGFEYNKDGDYYYTNKHSLQSHGGYMDAYEEVDQF